MANAYDRRLDDLLDLVNAGAMEPGAGTQAMWQLQDERRAKRQERRAAQQTAQGASLDSLLGLVGESVGPPANPTDALGMWQAQNQIQGGDLLGGLEAMYQYGGPTEGATTMWDTSPLIDATDRRELTSDALRMRESGTPINDIRARIQERAKTAYGIDYSDDIAQSVDDLLRKAFGG